MSETSCFNESYEDFTKKNNYHEHRLYLKNKDCCDLNSCNNLADEYEKLAEECNEAFKKHYETDITGKIMEPTLCSMNEDKSQDLRKKAAKYRTIQNEGPMPTPLPIQGPIVKTIQQTNYSETGGTNKNIKKYTKNKKNKKNKTNKKNKKNKTNTKKNKKKNINIKKKQQR